MSRFWGSGKFPYTNINNLNLDWMIKLVLELKAQVAAIVGELGTVYVKPETGIPKSDLSAGVQASLDKADTALQTIPDTYRTAAEQDVIDDAQDALIEPLYNAATVTGASISVTLPHRALIKKVELEILPQRIGEPSVETPAEFTEFRSVTINNNAVALPSGFYGGVIDYLTGKVKMHARVITFDGSELWQASTSAAENRKFFNYRLGAIGSHSLAASRGYCNMYSRTTITSTNLNIGFSIVNSSAYSGCMLQIRPVNSSSMTAPQWREYLAELANTGTPLRACVWKMDAPSESVVDASMDRVASGSLSLSADVGSWTVEYNDYVAVLSDFAASRAALELLSANVEETFTASKAYYVNDFLVIRDSLLKVTAPIQNGGTIQIGVNAVITTLGAEITALLNS